MVMRLGSLTIGRRNDILDYYVWSSQINYGLTKSSQNDFYILEMNPMQSQTSCEAGDMIAFLESLSLTTMKLTTVCNYTSGYEVNKQCNGTVNYNYRMCLRYNGIPLANVSLQYILNKYPNALRQTIDFANSTLLNPLTPAGSQWQFIYNNAVLSSLYPFFTASINCNNGWTCDSNTNFESYADSSCNFTQNNYCGECGCDSSNLRCNTPLITGTWCNDFNLTKPCCTDSLVSLGWLSTGACSYTNCYDLYTENPNPYNSSKNTFTTIYSDCSSNKPDSCPSNYMCVQYANPTTHLVEGKISCYNGQNGSSIYYNESGIAFNGTDLILNESVCENPSFYTNEWTCLVSNCHWCKGVCQSNLCSSSNVTEVVESGKFLDIPALACAFGEQSGMGCTGAKFIFGFMAIALIISSLNGLDYMLTKHHKFLPMELNLIFTLLLLGGFSFYIPLINPLLFISVLIVSVLYLANNLRKTTAGHGGE
jgi:hypothetical protein